MITIWQRDSPKLPGDIMEELSNKIKELNELKNKYKKRDDIISKKEAEMVKEKQQILSRIKEDTEPFHQDPVFRGPGNEGAEMVKEEQQILSRIKEVEKSLPSLGSEIEDTEPFYQDPIFRRPGNEERYFLLATQGAIRVRVYKGDEITAVKDPEKYNLSILRPLNERFKKFVDVIIKKAREAL